MLSCPHCQMPLAEAEPRLTRCPHCQQPLLLGAATLDVTPGQVTPDQPLEPPPAPAHKTVAIRRTVSGDPDAGLDQTIDSTYFSSSGADENLTPTIDSAEFPEGSSDPASSHTIDSAFLPADQGGASWTSKDQPQVGGASDFAPTIESSFVVPSDSRSRSASSSHAAQRSSGDEIDRRLRQVWGSQVTSGQPQMTMRGVNSSRDEFDEHTTLIIRERALRGAGETVAATIVDYDLLGVLGEGGMGVVYNARQASIDREVAVKMLKPEMTTSAMHRRKFLSEVAVTGELDHPNIVPIYDLGQNADGALFYSMKKVSGTPWSEVIRKTPAVENLTILMKVADAIAFAHSRGVVHRDLKPENVMLGDYGEVLVLDWGLAVATQGHRPTPNVSAEFNIAGSPAYMAPELVLGPMEAIGRHSDIYLLGAILYECITCRPPHGGKSAKDCLRNAARNIILPTDKHGELLDIALRAMHSDPQQRHPTVQAFQQAIRDYQAHSESIALCERAHEELQQATKSHDYQDYSRALFAYEEALQLWPGNENARRGVSRTRLEYAATALAKSDFDLGLSLVDAQDSAHAAIHQRLSESKAERDARQQRLARARRTMAALAALVFLAVSAGVVVASYLAYVARQSELKAVASAEAARQSEKDARNSESKAKNSERLARDSEAKAKSSEQRAKDSEANAIANQKLAVQETERAKKAESEAEKRREEAIESAYTALIAMAAARIDENAFDQARQALEQCEEKLRGWEWRRLMHVVQQGDVTRVALPSRAEVVAVNARGNLVATGGSDGFVRLWDRATRQSAGERRCGDKNTRITSLAFHPLDDQWLVVGLSEGPQPLAAWNRVTGELRKPAAEDHHEAGVVQVAFGSDGQSFLTASHDRTARLWSWQTLIPRKFAGHVGTVWSAALSPDGKLIATASEDGTVRIWDAATGDQLRSQGDARRIPFTGHQGAVYSVVFLPAPESISATASAEQPSPALDPPTYYLASAGYDRRVLLWQTDQLAPFDLQGLLDDQQVAATTFQELLGHSAQVRSLAVSADGTRLASAASDHTIRVWQLQDSDVARRGTLLKVLRGHAGPVYAAAFAPGDAGRIVSTGYDNQLRFWNVDEYDEERSMPGVAMRGHVGPVLSARFAPGGEQIVTASLDRTARSWQTATGRLQRVFREGHSYLASRVVFFPKSRRLLTVGGDGTARIWDLDRQAELRVLERTGYRAAAAISPDEKWIVTGSSDLVADSTRPHGAILHNARTGDRGPALSGVHKAPVTCVAWSPASERQLIFTGDDNGVFQLWDPQAGTPLGQRVDQHGSPIVAAAFTGDGMWLVTADSGGHVCRWDLSSPAAPVKAHEYPHPAGVQSLALTPDGKHLLTGGADGRLRLFARDGSEPLWMAERLTLDNKSLASADASVQESIAAVAVAWDAERELTVVIAVDALSRPGTSGNDSEEEYVRLFELDLARGDFREVTSEAGECLVNLRDHGAAGWSAAISADGRNLATVGRDEARLWDRGGNELAAFRPHQDLTFAEYSHGGDLVATASLDASVRVWHAATGQATMTLDAHTAGPLQGHTRPVNCAVFSPNDQSLFTASDDGSVRQWDLSNMKVVKVIEADAQGVTRLVLSQDGETLYSAGRSGTAAIWRLTDSSEPLRLQGHSGEILDLCLTADGRWLITASADNTARLWNATTGAEVLKLAGHASEVTAVATWSGAGGLRILTGSSDRTAKLWAVTGLDPITADAEQAAAAPAAKELLSLKGHTRGLSSVAFAADGRYALTAGRDGLTIVWPAIALPSAAAPNPEPASAGR